MSKNEGKSFIWREGSLTQVSHFHSILLTGPHLIPHTNPSHAIHITPSSQAHTLTPHTNSPQAVHIAPSSQPHTLTPRTNSPHSVHITPSSQAHTTHKLSSLCTHHSLRTGSHHTQTLLTLYTSIPPHRLTPHTNSPHSVHINPQYHTSILTSQQHTTQLLLHHRTTQLNTFHSNTPSHSHTLHTVTIVTPSHSTHSINTHPLPLVLTLAHTTQCHHSHILTPHTLHRCPSPSH